MALLRFCLWCPLLLLLLLLHCWRWGQGWGALVGRQGWQPLPVEGGGMERQGLSRRYGQAAGWRRGAQVRGAWVRLLRGEPVCV